MNPPLPGEHFFRHEYGRLVALLSRRVGVQHLEAIEDAVQAALVTALESWKGGGLPENPPAWLFRVANHRLLESLRTEARRARLIERQVPVESEGPALDPPLCGDVKDDLLRMLFVCCDEAIPAESRLVLALKTLCGFDVREIGERLFLSDANVYKRLARARARLRERPRLAEELSLEELGTRLPGVQAILYALFSEGYLSSHPEVIRRELCDEAKRLCLVLGEHPIGAMPETFALLALMHLHHARNTARQDGSGGLLLLEEQDRSLWDQREIQTGLAWLARSAQGDAFSRYHAEAGIAAEHCLAPSFAETRWDRIVETYALLERLAPSPLHTLNRALATAELHGPEAGLAVLEGLAPPSWLAGSHYWAAVLADLHGRSGHHELAKRYRAAALDTAPSGAVNAALRRRLGAG